MPGVVRTRVGYSGGTKENPTYHDLGDHMETVQIDYDPTQITYQELLDIFWESHNPAQQAWSRQYMTAVFYLNDEQEVLITETRDRESAEIQGKVYTQILPASEFYLAEDYHQKYWLQNEPAIVTEYREIYPDTANFVASTAAARVNGYLRGYGTVTQLEAELNGLGLSSEGSARLLEIVRALHR